MDGCWNQQEKCCFEDLLSSVRVSSFDLVSDTCCTQTSRIEYPCQQIAAPIAFSFVAFISSTLVGFGTWKRFKLLWHSRRFYMGVSVLAVGILLSGTLYIMSVDNSLMGQVIRKQIDNGTDMGRFVPIDAPNTPMGVARGIHPGRGGMGT